MFALLALESMGIHLVYKGVASSSAYLLACVMFVIEKLPCHREQREAIHFQDLSNIIDVKVE